MRGRDQAAEELLLFVLSKLTTIVLPLPECDNKLQNLMVERRPFRALVIVGSFISSRLLCQKGETLMLLQLGDSRVNLRRPIGSVTASHAYAPSGLTP